MNKRVLFAAAAVGVLATLPLACKKDDQPANQPNSFQGTNAYGQPGYAQPGYAQPGYAQPGTTQPGYAQPGYTQPGYTQPGTTQPGYGTPPAATTAAPPAGTATGQADPFGGLGTMIGGVLGTLGGGAGGTGNPATDPISLGIQHNASMNAKGMQPVGSMVRLNLQQGQTSEGQVQLTGGKCYTLVGASMPGVIEVAIQVTMPAPMTSQVLGQNDPGPNPMPVVWPNERCYQVPPSPVPIPLRLQVTMKQGAGKLGIQPYAK